MNWIFAIRQVAGDFTGLGGEAHVVVLAKAMQSGDGKKIDVARDVQAELDRILNSDMHRWYLGKISPEEREARQKAAEEFKKRYAQ